MYYYFCSEYLCAIKINGIYYGTLSSAVKSLRVDGKAPFVEICPLVDGELPLNFIPEQEFLRSPPSAISVTDLKGGYLIKCLRRNLTSVFNVLNQQKFNDCLVTVFSENGYKISIETANDFFAEPIFCSPKDVQIDRFEIDGHPFVSLLISDERKILYVFSINNCVKKVLVKEIESFETSNALIITEKFCDIAKHTVKGVWTVKDGQLTLKEKSVNVSKTLNASLLNEKIIPYVFAESFLVDGEWQDYLSDNVKENADKLKDYLGDFIGVMPPPKFRNFDEVGFIYRNKDNFYYVEYFTFEISNKKITNIKKCDN